MINQQEFFEPITDASLFYFKGYNLLKIFYNKYLDMAITRNQDSWQVNQRSKIAKAWYWFWQSLLLFIKAFLLRRGSYKKPPVLFYGPSGRHFQIEGITYDLYNKNIVDVWGRQQFIIIEKTPDDHPKQYNADLYTEGLRFWATLFYYLLAWFPLVDDFSAKGKKIAMKYSHLNLTTTQATQITTRFYSMFLLYGFLLDLLKPGQAIVVCYYGKEAFIAACKTRNIPVTELIHGTITRSHPHYNFSANGRILLDDRLLPDHLLVYGPYWKEVAVAGNFLPSRQIRIIGYYLKVPPILRIPTTHQKMTILIAGQPTIQESLISYIVFLKQNLEPKDWQIIIKPHPNENPAGYTPVLEEDFVQLTMANTYSLLAQADIHIGVYSSVVFEAGRYKLANYTLLVEPYLTFCQEIVETGIARPLALNELPELYQPTTEQINHHFAPFNPSVLRS